LPNCNLFTPHVLFILWRDTTSEQWTPVQFPLHCYHLFTLLVLFTFSHTTIAFHSICSFLCLQQTGEIDNLIVSWEQSSWLCCVQVARCCWRSKALDEAPYKLSGAIVKLASITFLSLAFSYWIDIPWFRNWGKTCYCTHQTFSWGFQLAGHLHHQLHANKIPTSFLAPLNTAPSSTCLQTICNVSCTILRFCYKLFLFVNYKQNERKLSTVRTQTKK
jgi:hypothetical protein